MGVRPSTFASITLLYVLWLSAAVLAYIPASPTNDTQKAIQSGLNVTDVSMLNLLWFENGPYSINVAYELVGAGSNGINRGALVHFGEKNLTNATTITPWIALVSCDYNSTDASLVDDIFTLARDRGAVSALLYSAYSSACIINEEYANPAHFDQVFDIFSTQSLTTARLIEERFDHIDRNLYGSFNAERLNESFYVINSTLNNGNSTGPGYIFATLRAYNATETNFPPSATPTNNTGDGTNQQQEKKTSLAMIILYVITGCVSVLFAIVIISGAIRAFRHPERYGPRGIDPTNPDDTMYPQSRAKGLARAVLDTFPIVKFNRPQDESQDAKDAEARGMELTQWEVVDAPVSSSEPGGSEQKATGEKSPPDRVTIEEGSPDGQPRRTAPRRSGTQASRQNPDVTPQTIGRETCPICIVDFEEGDDLRVLPCDGKHRFHQACVDPWLLELSSSCPLCREDFYALENMISGRSEDQYGAQESDYEYEYPSLTTSGRGRFSRYLRFATRRRGGGFREYSGYYDQTYPPTPPLPHQDERH
ncbi:hypothetical protein BDM02DRAFT_3087355 [Thelephora ganbajun]|uniref:Uncharacterized protein n=1 Tax=Thelephora ganbajun TaxID=370292 RepID=A0ACB6ZVA9_THEGA|nr:hypothetical protein BDM02DRAFT_3087355 [Thelephora ganbajun]